MALSRHGGLVSAGRPRDDQLDLRSAVMHPVALTMLVGNVGLLAVSFAQVI